MRRHQPTTATRSPLARVARTLGFRSVEEVHVVIGAGGCEADVTGVLHRYPQTVPVSLVTATRLAAAGALLRVESREGARS